MREGEVVQLLARWPNGMYLARTPYALGWVELEGLSSPLDRDAVAARLQRREPQMFTRRAVLTEAFAMLGEPMAGEAKTAATIARDSYSSCLRTSVSTCHGTAPAKRWPARSRSTYPASRISTRSGCCSKPPPAAAWCCLHFPGHIMLYLGTTEDGVPMAIHAFSEFLTPCEDIELETINRVDRIAVSDLSLGAGSSRRDFLSRITRMTVLGHAPGPALVANAEVRPSAPISMPEGGAPTPNGPRSFGRHIGPTLLSHCASSLLVSETLARPRSSSSPRTGPN